MVSFGCSWGVRYDCKQKDLPSHHDGQAFSLHGCLPFRRSWGVHKLYTMPNHSAIHKALDFLTDNSIPLPSDLHLQLESKGLLHPKRDGTKQAESIDEANKEYHDAITESLTGYFENGGNVSSYKNEFKRAVLNAFQDTYDLGWSDGGQELPIDDDDANSWLEARINQEFGFIDSLFQEAKELRKDTDFDYFEWITSKADGYVGTLREVYNQAKLRASDDMMVTFDGDDGGESCETCTSLKGVRHKISWFVKRNYVPPYGIGLQCARGGHCMHYLENDNGEQVTI